MMDPKKYKKIEQDPAQEETETDSKLEGLCFDVLEPWMPAYAQNLAPGQIAALDAMLQEISKSVAGIHILDVPCGCGKTTAISGLIAFFATVPKRPISAIILTDRNARLEEYLCSDLKKKIENVPQNSGHERRSYEQSVINLSAPINKGSVPVELAATTPVVLMSLQKWLLMDDRTRSALYYYTDLSGSCKKRDLMIIDEAVPIHEVMMVNNKTINAFRGTLVDRIPDMRIKNHCADVLTLFIQWIEWAEDSVSGTSANVTIPFRPAGLEEGQRYLGDATLLNVIKNHKDDLMVGNPDFAKIWLAIQNIVDPEAITIYHRGQNDGDGYRLFYTVIDNTEKFDATVPTYVLDGTANIDIRYRRWGTLRSFTRFTRDMSNMTINVYPAITNTTAVSNGSYRYNLYNEISKITASKADHSYFITGYKSFKDELCDIFGTDAVGTYGNITGRNCWQTCTKLIKTGVLRLPRLIPFLEAAFLYPEIWRHFTDFDLSDINQFQAACDELNAINADSPTALFKDEIDRVIVSRWMVETVQEIYRLKIRNYASTDAVTVEMFFYVDPGDFLNIYTIFFNQLRLYYQRYGAAVNLNCSHPELIDLHRSHRKSSDGSGSPTAYAKIKTVIDSYQKKPAFFEFTRNDLARTAGISDDCLKRVIADHPSLRDLLAALHVPGTRRPIRYRIHS